jgi:thiol-disulfide isomerase/thioredoxin
MYKILTISLVLLICFGSAADGKVKNFRLKDMDNNPTQYSDLKGEKLTIIEFWATWCKPCSRMTPKLIEIYERYKDQGVQLLGISVDSPRNIPKIKPFVRSKKITYPILLDSNSEVMSGFRVKVVPTVLFIDPDDNIIIFHQGYRAGDEKMFEEEIQKVLKGEKENSDEE